MRRWPEVSWCADTVWYWHAMTGGVMEVALYECPKCVCALVCVLSAVDPRGECM